MTQLDPGLVATWEARAEEARRGLNAPADWPRAERPLRVAIIGWACLSMQAREGSGYNLSVSELAAGLVAAGHEVYYLRSGMDFSIRPGMWVEPREFWRGVGCFDFVNSPNLATANWNFKNPLGQISSPEQTAIAMEWLRAIRADVVHVHSLEGFGFDLIHAVRKAGLPVVITPHNYYFLCPQVDLLQNEKRVCEDYEGGQKCAGCLNTPDVAAERRRRRLSHSGRMVVGHGTAWTLGQGLSFFKRHIKTLGNGHGIPITGAAALNGVVPPPVKIAPAPLDQNERLLSAKNHLVVLNDYGRRRAAAVAALNASSVILAPSRFLSSVHAAMGVRPELLRFIQLGQPHFDALGQLARQSPFYDLVPWCAATATRPLRLAYFGSTKYNKGLDTLVRSIGELPADVLARVHFTVRASGDIEPFRLQLHDAPQVSFHGAYDVADLPGSLGEFDVGVLPTVGLENSPFVLMEHLHAGKFVIASRLGGPTDWIKEPQNGLMFAAGDSGQLAATISRVARGEVALPSPRAVREASTLQSYRGHVAEVLGVYAEVARASRPVSS